MVDDKGTCVYKSGQAGGNIRIVEVKQLGK